MPPRPKARSACGTICVTVATEIALARSFDERPHAVMQLWEPEAYVVASMIEDRKLYAPLLLRLMRAQYGCADEVVYAPDHQLKVLKLEIQEFLKSASKEGDSNVLGENLWAKVTTGSVQDFLEKLLAVVSEGIAEKKGLFALTD